ncbi:Concanavalin A-like lectin/glucanases superfamily protein [Sphingobacterium nematocida]|uniref:Concanavalin A-like lectin/glucanases superfamily protein n=1 Tax=Sphingobacterium nematocida TaxID=1513896 RepID=A0A1T5GGY0_9SPHI|nr:LamG-like jellyroll fold domain-containing protein [Sphingobacterium nematocida]SKC07675.1 Concanavalin A-like lectin/glucanases superfamily protein [Sphingobacterium nematocida]
METKNKLKSIGLPTLLYIIVLLLSTGCNKDFPNLLKEFGEQPDYNSGSTKVLYVIADGIRGKALQQLELPNIRIITRNSLHSFGALGDFKGNAFTKESGLANLLTGVTNDKHLVTGDDLSVVNTEAYPSLLSRINAKNSSFSSAAFTSDADLSTTLLKDADVNVLSDNDDAVHAKAKEELSGGSASLIVTHYSDAYQVGLDNSFEANDPDYVAALGKFDSFLGELISTIKSRSSYAQEDWLVVISSSIGGKVVNDGLDKTSYGDDERNTITYFYSPKFTRGLLARPNSTEIPYDGNAVRYTYGADQVNATLTDASLYNFGTVTQDFTINFFFKSNVTTSHNYPIILSKRDQGFGGNGWNLFLEVRDGNNKIGWNSNISNQTFGTKQVNDGLWHSFTVTVRRSGLTDTIKVFTDGVFNAKNGVNANSLNNTAPLVIGKKVPDGNEGADFQLANLQIYNTAFTEAEVAKWSGAGLVDDAHAKKGNLIGYWPGYDDVGTKTLTDLSGHNNHMTLTGAYSWVSYSDIVTYFQPKITDSFYRLVPNGVDLPFFIYQWFGIVPKSSWGLEGKSWTPKLVVSSE